MRLLSGVAPALAALSLSTLVAAQKQDPNAVFQDNPDIAKPKAGNAFTPIKPAVRSSLATSIVSSLRSVKEAEEARTRTSTVKTSATPAKTTGKTTAKTTPKTSAAVSVNNNAASKKSSTTIQTTTKTVIVVSTKKATTTSAGKKAKRQATSSRTASTSSATSCVNKEINLLNYTPAVNGPLGFIQDNTLVQTSLQQWLPPAGYSTAFTGLVGAVQSTGIYLGTTQLASYDPAACARLCNLNGQCNGFNLYYQRNPFWIADKNCPNPEARAGVFCVLYSTYQDPLTAVNYGQYRVDFMVLITGSNGYNKNPQPLLQQGYNYPQPQIGAVNGTSSQYYMGYYFYTTAYDHSKCAAQCTSLTSTNRAAAIKKGVNSYSVCNLFNTFNMTYQGAYQGFYCVLYNDDDALTLGSNWTYTQNTNAGTTYTYNLTNSFTSALYPQDPGFVNTTWKGAPSNTTATCSQLGSVGSIFKDIGGTNYTLGCGYDVQYSNDIGNTNGIKDFFMCADLCDAFPGCNGYAYNWQTCYFKNLTGWTRTPQLNNYGTDMTWKSNGTGAYAGFDAGKIAATITYTTYTTAWTGASRTTTTSFNGLTGYVIVQTPGAVSATTTTAAGATVYSTVTVESGTAASIATITGAAVSGTATITTVYPTPPATCNNKGAEFALFSNKWPGGQGSNGYTVYTPQAYKTVTPTASGSATYIAESNAPGSTITAYGALTTGDNLVIAHTFYVYAGRGTGYYSFQIPYTDDIQFVWVGDKAVSGWTRANADIMQYWPNTNAVTIAFYLQFGSYTPVRIQWGNGGGQGAMQFNLFAPDGNLLISSSTTSNTGYMSPMIVQNPCNATLGAPFPAWGSET